ncbi:MAG: glycine cleavage system aminomethyltransferase GcvT [Cytophagaceae bacterium]|jgi:aminomethyltransferase|nr:glycine cleavage system aminomethyltransferase GcvT [Cytophagaceae bacterium]
MEVTSLKSVPLESKHISLGAKLVPFAGYSMPVRYSSDIDEHHAVRNAVGIFDVSHMGEFRITGPAALELIQQVSSNDASVLSDGKAQYACMPNLQGGIVDDIIIYRMHQEEYWIIVNASNIEKDFQWIQSFNKAGAKLENLSEQYCLFAVQGPLAKSTLQKITPVSLDEIPYYEFRMGEMAGIPSVFISNTGYTGAGGFELMVKNEHATQLFDAVMEAGAEFGIKPIGLGARDTLRLEMGFSLYGNDIDDTTSPLEAGLGWITKFSKTFNASDILLEQKSKGLARKLVAFELLERGIPRSHYDLCNAQGEKIGMVTSGTQSPTLWKGIGMGYVAAAYSALGTEIYVNIRGKLHKSLVCARPFLKK